MASDAGNPITGQYELAVSVKPQDIDQLDQVNSVVYLRWVQKAATVKS